MEKETKEPVAEPKGEEQKETPFVAARLLYNREMRLFHNPRKLETKHGRVHVVDTEYGEELACVAGGVAEAPPRKGRKRGSLVRAAGEKDLERHEGNREKAEKTLAIAREKAAKHRLPMRMIHAHHCFSGGKIIFSFTAAGRVDFRGLVKDLARIFKTRIELKQVGVRDGARMTGGHGVCGRQFCCTSHMYGFSPVSIKMAKEQNLSLNSVKISGCCGRLLCCLAYEFPAYHEAKGIYPAAGCRVEGEARGIVRGYNIQKQVVIVELSDDRQTVEIPLEKFGEGKPCRALPRQRSGQQRQKPRQPQKRPPEEQPRKPPDRPPPPQKVADPPAQK